MRVEQGLLLFGCGASDQHRAGPVGEQLLHDRHTVLWRLARAVHGFGQPLPESSVVIDSGNAQVHEGKPAELCHGLLGFDLAASNLVQQRLQ